MRPINHAIPGFAIPQAPEWLPRADNSHIVYVSFLDEETGRRYHKFRKNLFLTSKETTVFHGDELHSKIDVRPVWKRPALLFLLVVYIVLILLSGLPHLEVLSWLALAVLLWDLFRMFSRRIDRRRAENARFLALAGPAIRWLRMRRTIRRDKEHRYFKCQLRTVSAGARGRGRSPSTAATAAPAERS